MPSEGSNENYDGYQSTFRAPEFMTGGINPNVFSPMFGGEAEDSGVEYLGYETKGAVDRMLFNSGVSYLFGIATGGAYGIVDGWRTAPNPKLRIRINSVLNKSGKFGSRFGNALGVVACLFTAFEAGAEYVRVEDKIPLVREDIFNPIVAATLTGILYKSTQGPKTMAVAGMLGGVAAGAITGARIAVGPRRYF